MDRRTALNKNDCLAFPGLECVIDAAAARAERQLLRMRVKARKGAVRKQRAASAKN